MITHCRPTLGLRVGGLPVSAPYIGDGGSTRLSLSFSLSTSAHFIAVSSGTEELLVCVELQGSGSSPSSQSLPSVLPKNTEQIKAGDFCVCPTVGKARAQELVQEGQDDDFKTEICAQGRYQF